MKRLRKWLKWSVFLFVLSLLTMLAGAYFFPKVLAQFALERLRPYGFYATVTDADLLRARVDVKELTFRRHKPQQVLTLHAKKGRLSLHVWQVIFGRRFIPELHVVSPSIRVLRGKTVVKVVKRKKGGLSKARRLLRRLRKRGVEIGWLKIERGKVSFIDQSRPGRRLQLDISQLDTELRKWSGVLRVKRAVLSLKQAKKRIHIVIPNGNVTFRLDALLTEKPLIKKIELFSPIWRIDNTGKKRPRRKKKIARKLKLLAPHIELLKIHHGVLQLKRTQKHRRMKLSIKSFDADFRHMRGPIHLRGMKMANTSNDRTLLIRLPKAKVHMYLPSLIGGALQLKQLSLSKPTLNIQMKAGRKRKRKKRKIWLGFRSFRMRNGTISFRIQPGAKSKLPQGMRVRLSRLDATLNDFDTRYLLTQPFTGDGKAFLVGHGGWRFHSTILKSGVQRIKLMGFPVSVVNQVLGAKKLPLYIDMGRLDIILTLKKTGAGFMNATVHFAIRNFHAKIAKGQPGLKKLALRIAVGLLNRHFLNHPEGYRIQTTVTLKERELALRPDVFARVVGKRFLIAFFESVFQKHPKLGFLKAAVMKRLREGKKGKRGGFFAKFREGMKKRREKRKARREARKKRRQARREKRKKRRKERRKKIKAFIEKVKTNAKRRQDKRKKRRAERQKKRKQRRAERRKRRKKFLKNFKW